MSKSVTIVVGCKNRLSFLLQSLPSWIAHSQVKEIIIVDWSSDTPIQPIIEKKFHDARISVLRVNSTEPLSWHLSACLNFGIRHVRTAQVLKLDADYILAPHFFDVHSLKEGTFFRGNYKIARNDNETHLNGALFCWLSDFLRVGGYNEYIRSYGYDDTDLYSRFEKHGSLTGLDFVLDSISHSSHGDHLRILDSPEHPVQLSTMINMFVATKYPWTKALFLQSESNYGLSILPHQSPNFFVGDSHHFQVSEKVMHECTELAKRCILNDHHNLSWNLTNQKSSLFIQKLFEMRNRPKFILRGLNGLGNKWRAMASAGAIAKKLNFILIIEWIPDIHCQAEMKDLFEINNILVSNVPIQQDKHHQHDHSFSDVCFSSLDFKGQLTTFDHEMLESIEKKGYFFYSSACVLPSSFTSYQDESNWIIQYFRPVNRILERLSQYAIQIPFHQCIGIHSRRGQSIQGHQYEDYSTWSPIQIQKCKLARSQSHYIHFMREMKRWRLIDPEQKFFICADRKSTYAAFQKEFSNDPYLFFIDRESYDRSIQELDAAIIDLSLLSRTQLLLGSPWSTFTELVGRLGNSCRLAGKDFSTAYRGILMYQNQLGQNVGDNIQSLAAMQWYSHDFDYWINRDLIQPLKCDFQIHEDRVSKIQSLIQLDTLDDPDCVMESVNTFLPAQPPPETWVKLIFNGWCDGRVSQWPLPSTISPCFISIHINEDKTLFDQSLYSHLSFTPQRSYFDCKSKIDYWLQHAPIGCRDTHTLKLFQHHGIPAYHSSCLTLSLKKDPQIATVDPKDKKIYVVDAHILAKDLFYSLVPQQIQSSAVYLSHALKTEMSNRDKIKEASKLLHLYQEAKYVITSRLHCALPCLAFGVPVLFLLPNMDKDIRFDETFHALLGNGSTLPPGWNWNNPQITELQSSLIRKFQLLHQEKMHAFLKKP